MTEQILNHENQIQHVKPECPKDVSSQHRRKRKPNASSPWQPRSRRRYGSAYLSNFARFRYINQPLSLRFPRLSQRMPKCQEAMNAGQRNVAQACSNQASSQLEAPWNTRRTLLTVGAFHAHLSRNPAMRQECFSNMIPSEALLAMDLVGRSATRLVWHALVWAMSGLPYQAKLFGGLCFQRNHPAQLVDRTW